jgi:hypothetical protein
VIFVLLAMGGTGLVLAGTDIYYPPLGSTMKAWVAEDQARLKEIRPYSKVNVNEAGYNEENLAGYNEENLLCRFTSRSTTC